jgi:ferric-dicitrate binding protein FerR (iron transport regulator)
MNAKQIRDFLEKYTAGMHTETEHQQFIDWLKTASVAEVESVTDEYWLLVKKNQSERERINNKIALQIEKALTQYELGNQKTAQPKQAVVHYRIWYGVVAAFLIISFAGYWLYTMQARENKSLLSTRSAPQLASNEILPGSNKAILTLGNGSAISLDDARNGTVATEGGTQISKMGNGEIRYVAGEASDQVFFNTLRTPRGGQFKLRLPDGSDVWLNASSSIRYPTTFTGNERKVEVTGEAYFEIAHDRSHPFLVTVDDMTIQVVGTHFNVNAYPEEMTTKTTLLEGSVRLFKAGSHTSLVPGQQAQFSSKGQFTLLENVDLDEVVAWKNGFFSFTKADLQTVMRQIARWYDVDITYEGAVPQRQFGGKIGRNSSIVEVIKILQETKVNFRIVGKKIIVTP